MYCLRAWESLKAATCCESLVIVYNGICLIQIGMVAKSPQDNKSVIVNTEKLMQGSVYQGVMKSKSRKCSTKSRFKVFFFCVRNVELSKKE